MKKISIAISVIIAALSFYFYLRHPLTTQITINNHTYNVELAVTSGEKEKGLGYRDKLPDNSGMLFVYDHPDQYHFWMKGMKFPLDFVWINGVTVIDLTPNVTPVKFGQNLPSYYPKTPADKVLEINAGEIAKSNIKIGDTVKIIN